MSADGHREASHEASVRQRDLPARWRVARIYRQRHPVEAVKLAGEELGLFAHIDEEVTC